MSRTLYAKLAVVSLALFCALGVVYVALSIYTTERHFQEVQQKLNQDLAEHLVNEKILLADGQVDETVLEDVFHMLMVINPSIELYLLDPAGAVLAFSAPEGSVVRKSVSLEPIGKILEPGDAPDSSATTRATRAVGKYFLWRPYAYRICRATFTSSLQARNMIRRRRWFSGATFCA